jgi:purine-cytosine permease-like protein
MNETSSNESMAQKFLYFYATLLTVLSFGFVFWASFIHDYSTNPDSKDIINMVLGFVLGVALSGIVSYFFGSSAGSKRKDDRIAELIQDETK